MPRLAKPAREKQMDAAAERIRHHYYDALYVRRLTARQAALSLGFMSSDTLLRRLNNPADFTLGELSACANAMNISLVSLISGKEE